MFALINRFKNNFCIPATKLVANRIDKVIGRGVNLANLIFLSVAKE
jgi:hypothetical protein